MSNNQVAIVGAGFAGLALCWHLTNAGYQITLYDQVGVGGGASGVAPGLLHPFAGRRARKVPHGDAGMEATRHLLDIAGQAIGRPIYRKDGILRIPTYDEQVTDFRAAVDSNDEVEWWEADRCQEALPGSQAGPGIFISSGITICTKGYMKGLWQACENQGARLVIGTPERLDIPTIYAAGIDSPIPMTPIKGQALEIEWRLPPPKVTLATPKYLVVRGDRAILGATYERDFESRQPDLERAKELILPKITAIYPQLADAKIINVVAGVRASPGGNRQPIVKRLDTHRWLFTGFGSKGLLYTSLFAHRFVEIFRTDDR